MAIDLELATIPDIVTELNKRRNCPYILMFHNPETHTHEIVWNEQAFPSVFHVMQELTICQSQFIQYLHTAWQQDQQERTEPDDDSD